MPSAPATSLFLGSAALASPIAPAVALIVAGSVGVARAALVSGLAGGVAPIALDAVFVAVQLGARTSPCTS